MKKTWFAAALICLFLGACNYQLTLDAPKLSASPRPISKILFIEKSTQQTTEFLNSLRKDLMKNTVRQPIEQQFFYVRLLDSDGNRDQRLAESLAKNQPDAIMFLECVDAKRCAKWGVNRNSICRTNVKAVLEDAKNHEKLWEGTFFLKQKWGVDVISDKMAEQFWPNSKPMAGSKTNEKAKK